MALLGIAKTDTRDDVTYLVNKLVELRLFADEEGKLNRDIREMNGAILLVSNFTLYGDTRKGKRPGFDRAARPEEARPFYDFFVESLAGTGVPTVTGVFQAHMRLLLENDGPVTLICDSP